MKILFLFLVFNVTCDNDDNQNDDDVDYKEENDDNHGGDDIYK